ncbi:MAG TPA: hypothetical protein VID27_01525, partial [Blastocatellia bacterium]
QIADEVLSILEGRARSKDVTEEEAREMAYHYTRVHLKDKVRPMRIEQTDGEDERLWVVEMVSRESGTKEGELRIAVETGSIHSWQPTGAMS